MVAEAGKTSNRVGMDVEPSERMATDRSTDHSPTRETTNTRYQHGAKIHPEDGQLAVFGRQPAPWNGPGQESESIRTTLQKRIGGPLIPDRGSGTMPGKHHDMVRKLKQTPQGHLHGVGVRGRKVDASH